MPLRINTNTTAFNARRILENTGRSLALHLERLSTGLRVNRAADDAAGLTISERIRGEINGFNQGTQNSEQAINLLQTADGALGQIGGILLRMRTLAVQSASSTVSDANRQSLNSEFTQLVGEADRISSSTSYNKTNLLAGYGNAVNQNLSASSALASATTGVTGVQISGAGAGTYVFIDNAGNNRLTLGNGLATQTLNIGPLLDADAAGGVVATGSDVIANFDRLGIQLTLSGQKSADGLQPATDGYRDGDLNGRSLTVESGQGGTFQVGAFNGAAQRLQVSIADLRASGPVLNLGSLSVASLPSAQSAISSIDHAVSQVTAARGNLGAVQDRLSFNIGANGVMAESNQATDSTIRDADVAKEVSGFSRAQILSRTGLAVFAQANLSPASALSLL